MRTALAISLSAAAAGGSLAGCGEQSPDLQSPPRPRVPVHNILNVDIPMSAYPDYYDPSVRTGVIRPGQTAVARCVSTAVGSPESTMLLVEKDDASGWVGAFTAAAPKRDAPARPEIAPNLHTLLTKLPECSDDHSGSG